MSARGWRSLGHALVLVLLLALAWWLTQEHDSNGPVDALPAVLQGVPRILDADTWELDGHRLRIDGLDAPEFAQQCGPADAPWPCGREAITALRTHLRQRPVHCDVHGRDRYRRVLATCHAGEESLSRWLVRNGWAVAYGRSGDGEDYTREELQAQRERAGIWRDDFTRPQAWRRQSR
ncbi:MAG: thermonuclease family protein [Pseudoxanthomonas suwonensis]|nr:thermonuclease family protein [Pseudoxanthomonas suwonensis]